MRCCNINAEKKVILGFYPLRGKCQVCRLLCEYTGLTYQDLFFTPQCWQQFKEQKTHDWTFAQLPFLMDKDFVTTDMYSMSFYITHKSGQEHLMGKDVSDQARVDMFISQNDIVGCCFSKYIAIKDEKEQQRGILMSEFLSEVILPKLKKIEKDSHQNFYLGYISVVDFLIYEIFYFLCRIPTNIITSLPKFEAIYKNIASLPQIEAYEKSEKCVKNICPLQFCNAWKSKCNSSVCK